MTYNNAPQTNEKRHAVKHSNGVCTPFCSHQKIPKSANKLTNNTKKPAESLKRNIQILPHRKN